MGAIMPCKKREHVDQGPADSDNGKLHSWDVHTSSLPISTHSSSFEASDAEIMPGNMPSSLYQWRQQKQRKLEHLRAIGRSGVISRAKNRQAAAVTEATGNSEHPQMLGPAEKPSSRVLRPRRVQEPGVPGSLTPAVPQLTKMASSTVSQGDTKSQQTKISQPSPSCAPAERDDSEQPQNIAEQPLNSASGQLDVWEMALERQRTCLLPTAAAMENIGELLTQLETHEQHILRLMNEKLQLKGDLAAGTAGTTGSAAAAAASTRAEAVAAANTAPDSSGSWAIWDDAALFDVFSKLACPSCYKTGCFERKQLGIAGLVTDLKIACSECSWQSRIANSSSMDCMLTLASLQQASKHAFTSNT